MVGVGRQAAGTRASTTSRGFTLIELMITVVILAVLAGLAAPAFRNFLAQQRVRSASMELRMALTMARSEAVKRNDRVTLARVGGDWSGGWAVPDPNNASVNLLDYAPVEEVTITGPGANVTFRPSGRADVSGTQSFTVAIPGVSAATPSCVQLFPSGRSQSDKGACS